VHRPLYKGGPHGIGGHTTASHMPPPPPRYIAPFSPPTLLSCGLLKGCAGVESTPPLHAVVLCNFQIRSEAIYFRNLGWFRDSEGCLDHRTCVSTRRCCHLWHQSHFAKFFTTLRSATLATSSTLMWECNPCVWSGMLPKL
jgi:hypothetical protein